jgi:hypothetical protein
MADGSTTSGGAALDAYSKSEWPRVAAAHLSEIDAPDTDDQMAAAVKRLDDAGKAICSQAVRSLDDLVVRAAIAAHCSGDVLSNPRGIDEVAFASLVRGVLDLAGLQVGGNGQLSMKS